MNDSIPQDTEAAALTLRIEKLVTGGGGLARHEGQAVFVPLTAPGDEVRARVVKSKKGFADAELLEVLTPGPDRAEPPCPHYGACGGCDLQHLAPDGQRAAKAAIVADCFQRLGKLDVAGILTGPEPTGGDLGHRNRIRLFASPMGPYGLMRRGSHEVVPLDACPVMPGRFNTDILPWLRMMPPVEQIVVRLDAADNWLLSAFGPPARLRLLKKILATLPEEGPPAPGCVGVLFNNLPLWGRDYLVHELAGHKYRVSSRSFFQGNFAVTEEAVATVRSWLGEVRDAGRLGPLLGDVFCGVGLFSLALADLFEEVVAIDADPHACRDAENNVKRDAAARGKVTIHKGPVAKVLGNENLGAPERWREACCVVDPPREGLGKDGSAVLLARGPRQILFMSCDPATLARDAATCAAAGYELTRLRVLDMFPQTSHIETLALLERAD